MLLRFFVQIRLLVVECAVGVEQVVEQSVFGRPLPPVWKISKTAPFVCSSGNALEQLLLRGRER